MSNTHLAHSSPIASEPGPAPRRTASGIVPRAQVDVGSLSYHLLHPRNAGPADLPLLGEAYRCWSEVWKQTFMERDNRSYLPSDDFTRQDEIGAVFHGYECIALSFFRYVDLANPIYRDDSYFGVWPEGARIKACSEGTSVCVSSSFTVAAPWRSATGCSVKDLLCALVLERFIASKADTLVGTMRNDKGMNTLVYGMGARSLEYTVDYHGGPVDLIAFQRSCTRIPLGTRDEAVVQRLRPRTPF